MKTIEDVSRVFSLNEVDKLKENDLKELPKSFAFAVSMDSFREGVEFVQRWIPIEEELPVKGGNLFNDSDTVLIKVLLKDGNIKILTGHYDLSMKDWYIDATHYNGIVIEWRPIKYN